MKCESQNRAAPRATQNTHAPSSASRARFDFAEDDAAEDDAAEDDAAEDDVVEEAGGSDDDTPMIARQRVQRTRRPDAPARATRSSGCEK